MKHLPYYKTLGVAALAAMLAPTAAMAQIQTYYRAGTWEAFSGRNDKGGAVCGVDNTNPTDNRRMSIRFDIGGSETVLSASKPDWTIPDGTRITVVMQIGLNTPWTRSATGYGNNIDWALDPASTQTFEQQFRGASSMTLTFPDGNEPPWTVPLIGSSAISATFSRCITDLTRQVQAAQAAGATKPAAPQQTQAATQPFSAPASGAQPSTDTTAPAAQPSGSQTTGNQPAGTQPTGGTQTGGTQPAH
ncbi:hypothetical protein [Acidisphaera sp. S103]|uniref:hypothetical protein n=1 Tax=Acidisphaera sp. S103 TaxID=1747223 RepID=UPI00131BA1A4|nr:hypothetical protein [Acidisphaera sp. S103]